MHMRSGLGLVQTVENEVGKTSQDTGSREGHYPGQDHVTHSRPAHVVQASEKADSDYG